MSGHFGFNDQRGAYKQARVVVTTNQATPPASFDGVTLAVGDPVLLTGQTNKEENGLREVGPSSWLVWRYWRQPDHLTKGCLVQIAEGSAEGGTIWRLDTAEPGGGYEIGTTELDFTKVINADGSAAEAGTASSIQDASGQAGEGQFPLPDMSWSPGGAESLSGVTEGTLGTFKTWDFDADADEYVIVVGANTYNSGYLDGYTVRVDWAAASATTGNVRWKAEIDSVTGARALGSDAWGTAKFATSAAPGTAGNKQSASFTFTNLDAGSPSSCDLMRLRITRVGTDGLDTMLGDAQVVAACLYESD